MRWRRGAGSDQIEDRRGMGMGLPLGGGGLGLIGLLLYLFLGNLGGDSAGIPLPQAPAQGSRPLDNAPEPTEQEEFVRFVSEHVQSTWAAIFRDGDRRYDQTVIVLYDGVTQTGGCGTGSAQAGPFYCPADSKLYLDMSFFRELHERFGAPGDFAQAYVIAHEYGHHVQNLLGIDDEVRRRSQEGDANELSVRQELQADCLAGVWAHAAYRDELLEEGDLREGLDAAAAVGDDRIQRQSGQAVNPESWTHGSSQQRMEWFDRGYRSGSPDDCDTFA